MNLLHVVILISVGLTILSILVALVIIGLHLFTERQIRHDAEFRQSVGPLVEKYLQGAVSMEAAVVALRKDPREALRLLAELAAVAEPPQRDRLHELFAAFPFVRHELAALKSKRRETRLQSAQLLGYLMDESATTGLLEALDDEFLAVRLAAAQSLGKLGCAKAVRPIVHALDVPGEMPQRPLAEALLEFGPRAIPGILDLLNDPQITDTALAVVARVSGMLRATAAASRLVDLLGHPVMEIRLNSVRALAFLGDRAAIPAISRLAGDQAWEVRNGVMHALGYLRATDCAPLLAQALADPAWWVRFSAAQALYHLGKEGISVLKEAAAHHEDRYAHDMSRQILQEHGVHHYPSEAPL